MPRTSFAIFIFLLLDTITVFSQITVFPYRENFDLVVTPALPSGWTTTTNKNINGDFTTSTTTVLSGPNALSTTDATKPQSVITGYFNFKGKLADSLEFYERRTSTHTSGLLIEGAIGNDTTFPILIVDTLKFVNGTSYVRRNFSLPTIFNNKDSVRFRFRIAGNGSGTTGILRIDDLSLTIKKAIDLTLTSLSAPSSSLKQGDQITATITIKNNALAGNFSGTIQLFDSLTLINSQIFSQPFGINESLAVAIQYPNIKAGRHPLIAKLILTEDEDTTNNSASLVVNAGYRQRTMLINEIMYAPTTAPEWVEIVNNSTDTLSISGWKFSDATTNRAVISPSNRMIAPNSYFIVTTDTSLLKNSYSISSPVLQAPFSALNNTGDAVILFDNTGSVIDSLTFASSWGGSTEGRSLERIDTAGPSTLQSNWKSSIHPLGATPGTINSVAQKSYDAAITRMTSVPLFPTVGNSITLGTTIKNVGKQSLSSLNFQLFIDANKDSLLSANEMYFQQNISFLNANDSTTLQTIIPFLLQGAHWIFSKISSLQDNDTTNNLFFFPLAIGIPQKSIVINEVMYAPPGDMPEWIEGYNTTTSSINLTGWKISDNGTTKALVQSAVTSVATGSYFTITTDTTTFKNYFTTSSPLFQAAIPALNNSSPDAVVIVDERGATMDSIYYKQSWGGLNGNSLQRFDIFSISSDSSNWKSDVPSPGNENVSARKDRDVEITSISPQKNSTGLTITAVIFNSGREQANELTVNFYHDKNHDSTVQQTELIHSAQVVALNPLDSAAVLYNWTIALQGMQSIIVTVDAANDMRPANNSKTVIAKNNYLPQTLVINEIMYEPLSGKSEFVELFNRTADTIDIAEWKLMDQPSSSGSRAVISLSKNSTLVSPKGFIVVASDSSIVNQFPLLAGKNIIINSSLSLSNSGEDIVVVDLTNTQIDSVRYSPLWHLKNISSSGRSLERINPSMQTNDARNWSSSVSAVGATPAAPNSIVTVSAPLTSALNLSPNPFSPDNDGFEDFLSINYSLPANSATIRVRIFDVTGRLIRRLAEGEPSPSAGSILWNGIDDDGNRVRIGMYIILFEALDNFGGTAKSMKDVAVVARKL